MTDFFLFLASVSFGIALGITLPTNYLIPFQLILVVIGAMLLICRWIHTMAPKSQIDKVLESTIDIQSQIATQMSVPKEVLEGNQSNYSSAKLEYSRYYANPHIFPQKNTSEQDDNVS